MDKTDRKQPWLKTIQQDNYSVTFHVTIFRILTLPKPSKISDNKKHALCCNDLATQT